MPFTPDQFLGGRSSGDGRRSILTAIGCTNGQQVYDILTNKNSAYGSTTAAPSVVDSGICVDNLAFDGNKFCHVAPDLNGSDGTAHSIYFSRVTNCCISNVYSADQHTDSFVYEYSTDSSLVGCSSSGARKAGVYFTGCENVVAAGVNSESDGNAVILAASWYCAVVGCTARNWGSFLAAGGIALTADSRYNTVSGNTLSGGIGIGQGGIQIYPRPVNNPPTVHGIQYGDTNTEAYGGSFNTISGNTISKSAGIGIYITSGQGAIGYATNYPVTDWNIIENNVITENGGVGILNELSQNNRFVGNLVTNNGGTGIRLSSFLHVNAMDPPSRNSTGNVVVENTIVDQLIQEPTSPTKTHNSATQTVAYEEVNVNAAGTDNNIFERNTTTGTTTLLGTTTKAYSAPARVDASGATTISGTSFTDISGASLTFTALRPGKMRVDAMFDVIITAGAGLGNLLVGAVTVNGTQQSEQGVWGIESGRGVLHLTVAFDISAGTSYTVKLQAKMTGAVTTYSVATTHTGFTYWLP